MSESKKVQMKLRRVVTIDSPLPPYFSHGHRFIYYSFIQSCIFLASVERRTKSRNRVRWRSASLTKFSIPPTPPPPPPPHCDRMPYDFPLEAAAITEHSGDAFATRLIHVGSEADPSTGAVIPALSLSTTFKQDRIGDLKQVSCIAGRQKGRRGGKEGSTTL